jgi:putative transposase
VSTIAINKGDLIQHPKGLCRFMEWDNYNVMVFKPLAGGKEIRLPEHQFVTMHGHAEIRLIEQDADGKPIALREFGPDEAWTDPDDPKKAQLTEEGRRGLALQFYTKEWDKLGNGSLGDKGLQKLITDRRGTALSLGYETKEATNGKKPFRVEVARLRHCIKQCGRPGERPLAAFRSLKGKYSTRRFKPEIEKALKDTIAYFYSKRTVSHINAYCFFRDEVKAVNAKRRADDKLTLPRPDVVRRRINRAVTYDNWARKTSPKEAWQKMHGRREHISAARPLELVIMDATLLDAHMVLDTTTLLPLGRPWLTVCLDVATRMPLGYVVTFEPPNLYSVLLTLKRVNKNKQYVSKLYPQITRPWDGWGCPTEILLDRDWSHQSPSFQHSMSNVGTEVHWAPSRTPQYKAIGERFFLTAKKWFIEKIPGGVMYNPYVMRQVGLDPAADAVVTLEDFDELMHEFIDSYIYEIHDGIKAVPARVWTDGLAIQRRRWIKDVASLDHMLGRVDTATLRPTGINFKNIRFHDEATTSMLIEDILRFEKKRSQSPLPFGPASMKVLVKWNPADAGSISIWNRGGEPHPHYVTLPNTDDYYQGLSFWHDERIREYARAHDLDPDKVEERWEARNRLRKHCEALASDMPLRDTRRARRSLGWSLGQFDDTTVNDMPDLTQDDVVDVEVEASTAGLNRPDAIPDAIAAEMLDADNTPPKGRTPSKTTVAKTKRTKAKNKAAKAEAEHEAHVKEMRGDPTGEPAARGIPVEEDDAGGEGWDEPVTAPRTAADEQTDDEFADDEGW